MDGPEARRVVLRMGTHNAQIRAPAIRFVNIGNAFLLIRGEQPPCCWQSSKYLILALPR
jgi:hypothetical protein